MAPVWRVHPPLSLENAFWAKRRAGGGGRTSSFPGFGIFLATHAALQVWCGMQDGGEALQCGLGKGSKGSHLLVCQPLISQHFHRWSRQFHQQRQGRGSHRPLLLLRGRKEGHYHPPLAKFDIPPPLKIPFEYPGGGIKEGGGHKIPAAWGLPNIQPPPPPRSLKNAFWAEKKGGGGGGRGAYTFSLEYPPFL